MKRFGYLRDYMHFNLYNTTKMFYVKHPLYGPMELPKNPPGKSAHKIYVQAMNYNKRLEYEKYLNPKGLKPTITSSFPRPQQVFDFANLDICRVIPGKNYGPGILCFRSATNLSKPEVKQFLTKLYNLPVVSVRSTLKQGKVKRSRYKLKKLSLIHICRCRRLLTCRSRWSPDH
eukprot:TRINITY_DN19122_c0_g1_i1.p1 TRINITY_DN19122_c0_g1~~TRINITY_DN19122_c0_g1_i1.p1  ORF type:complete len:174 (+),score=34.91 TRINITY_DN19122_c0_g1_i1:116-637(+)